MADSNPFAFTGSRKPQSMSSESSQRARLTRLEREVTTLQRNLREANDAIREANDANAATNKAANDKVRDAEIETQRAQKAEGIARKALFDVHYQLTLAKKATAELEEKMKLQQVQEHPMMDYELQVEPETSQDSPSNVSAAAGDSNEIHANCQRERTQLIAQFEELCKTTSQQHVNEQLAVEAAYKAKLEESHKSKDSYIETLEGNLTEITNRMEALQKEVAQNARRAETAMIFKETVQAREDDLYKLQLRFEEQAVNHHAETSRTNAEKQQELHAAEVELMSLRSEMGGLRTENKSYAEKLAEMRDEIVELGTRQEHQRRVEKHLSENNDRLLADLQEERIRHTTAVAECDELKVQLAETEKVLHDIAESKAELQEDYDSLKYESESAAGGAVQQLMELQNDADRLLAEAEEHARNISGRDQHIDSLEHDIEVLRGVNVNLKNQNEMLQASKKVPRSQPGDHLVPEPALEFLSRPDSNRSISMASHTSLADELDHDSDFSDQISIADKESLPKHVGLDFSGVECVIDDAPHQPAQPHLTVTVGEAIARTPRAHQDSPQESSPVDSALAMSPITVVDGAPFRPTPALLASSNITIIGSEPIETNVVSQRLTMHVFKQSVIRIDPKNPVQRRTAPTSKRRSPLELFPASSGRWPLGDGLCDQDAASVATQTTFSASDSPTVVGDLPDPIAKSPRIISSTHIGGSNPYKKVSALLSLLVFCFFQRLPLPVIGMFLAIVLASLQLYSAITKPGSTLSGRVLNPTVHYTLHLLMLPLAFFCWRFWSQVHAWEQANGVGFGEGFGGTYDNFGPYGNGHYILSKLPLNWVSADSQLPVRAVEAIASTVSAFEGLIGLAPTPSF